MEGLKSLQYSGVDIHTIACILALGEISPACIEFRNTLHVARKKQRTQTWWIHKLVEYGPGTNFVVDELLKTRAGENVLALTTAVASVCEEQFGTVLTVLYDKLKTPSHSTPSLGQLERLRSLCLPLARDMDFKDRLVEIQIWIGNQIDSSYHPLMADAIPKPSTMADLVMTLTKVAREWEENKSVLVYQGMEGAAWVINYSWNVLRLPVCIIDADGNLDCTISRTPYASCAVIIYLATEGPPRILQNIESASNIIVLKNPERESVEYPWAFKNWLISCGGDRGVDVIQLFCGWDVGDRQELGNLIFTIAYELIQFRIALPGGKPESFFENPEMGAITTALERVLLHFGLPTGFRFVPDWRKSHVERTDDSPISTEITNLDVFDRIPWDGGNRSIICREYQEACTHNRLFRSETEDRHLVLCPRCCVKNAILNVAHVASTLAFTDWGEHFQMLSTKSLSVSQRYKEWHVWFDRLIDWTPGTTLPNEPSIKDLVLDHDSLAKHVSDICSGSKHARDIITSNSHKFLGLDIDGMLLILYRAVETSLQPGPIFVIRTGEFKLQEDRRTVLSESYTGGVSFGGSTLPVPSPTASSITPWNGFVGWCISVKASLLRDSIDLSYTAKTDDHDDRTGWVNISIIQTQRMLKYIRVPSSCQHPTDEPLPVTKAEFAHSQSNNGCCDSANRLWLVVNTIFPELLLFETAGGRSVCQYIPTSNNDVAQLVVASILNRYFDHANNQGHLAILQKHACIQCTRDQAEQWKGSNTGQIVMFSG